MLDSLLAPQYLILAVWLSAAAFVHLRGKERLRFHRQLLDHSTLLAPYNCLLYLFSDVPQKAYQDLSRFEELEPLRENWETIRDEALGLMQGEGIRAPEAKNDLAFNTFFKRGWKRFYLRWYDDYLPSAREGCPKTIELLEQVPGINAALFTLLPPGARLGRHRDPFAGSLRYHLGLVTPEGDPRCWIKVDGEPYSWRDGEGVLFDETFLHEALNETDTTRLILFCDFERPIRNPVVRWINRFVNRNVARISASNNVPGEKLGALNYAATWVYKLKSLFIYLKSINHRAYYTVKYLLLGLLVYAVFLRGLF